MMFERKIAARLNTIADNAYALVAPDDFVTPAVVYARNGTKFTKNFDDDDTGEEIDLQIDVYDPDYEVALDLADEIRNNLKAWNDDGIQAASPTGEVHLIDDTTDKVLFNIRMTFAVYASG